MTKLHEVASVVTFPAVFSSDGMLIKPGCQRDPISNELVGTCAKIDMKYIQENPKPDPSMIKKIIYTSAVVGILTTVDNKLTVPISFNFETSSYMYEELK